jgi:hypothetical protein
MKEARMRISVITWFASSIILIGGALLAALAQDAKERPHHKFISRHSIDTRELTERATAPLPLQFYDVI